MIYDFHPSITVKHFLEQQNDREVSPVGLIGRQGEIRYSIPERAYYYYYFFYYFFFSKTSKELWNIRGMIGFNIINFFCIFIFYF